MEGGPLRSDAYNHRENSGFFAGIFVWSSSYFDYFSAVIKM